MARQSAEPGRPSIKRPMPPESIFGGYPFAPAPELMEWLTGAFITENGPLHNPDHAHLEHAVIGALWTSAPNSRQGKTIVGQAELIPPQGAMNKWLKARVQQQLDEWFGASLGPLDFLITINGGYATACDDISFCALIEHELYHCGPELDEFGQPKFSRDGMPKFAMRAHDVEEFTGVVRRYGSDASAAAALVEAARRPPEIGRAAVAGACGSCLKRVA